MFQKQASVTASLFRCAPIDCAMFGNSSELMIADSFTGYA